MCSSLPVALVAVLLVSVVGLADHAAAVEPGRIRLKEAPIRNAAPGLDYPDAGNFSPAVGEPEADRLSAPVGALNRRGVLHFTRPDATGLGSLFPPGLAQIPQRANRDARAADLNGDGHPDLVVNTYAALGVPVQLRLFLNNQRGGHREIFDFARTTGGAPLTVEQLRGRGETIVVADFNGDGRPDIYVPYYTFPFYARIACAPGDANCNPIPADCATDPYCDAASIPVECPETDPLECGPNAAASILLINAGNGLFGAAADEPVFIEVAVPAGSQFQANVALSRRFPGGTGALDPCGHQPEGTQAVDYDGDGRIDLFVSGHLFRNTGNSMISTAAGNLAIPQFEDVTLALGLYDQIDVATVVPVAIRRDQCAATGACNATTCPINNGSGTPAADDVCAVTQQSVAQVMAAQQLLKSDGVSLNCVRAAGTHSNEFRKYFVDAGEFTAASTLRRFRLFEEGAKFLDWNNDGCLDLAIVKTWSSHTSGQIAIGAPTAYNPLDRREGLNPGDTAESVKHAGMRLFECQPDGQGRPLRYRERIFAGASEPVSPAGGAFFQIGPAQSQQYHFMTQAIFGFNTADLDGDGREDVITLRGHVFQNMGDRFTSVGSSAWEWGGLYESFLSSITRGGIGFGDFDRDGRIDFLYSTRNTAENLDANGFPVDLPAPYSMTLFANRSIRPAGAGTILVEVLDAADRRNQQGRLIRVRKPSGGAPFARLVDGGSSYLSQTEYLVQVATTEPGNHTIEVVYPGGTVSCTVPPGKHLRVRPTGTRCEQWNLPAPATQGSRSANAGLFRGSGSAPGIVVENETDGTLVVWSAAGNQFTGDWGETPAPGYRLAGVGDFDGDGDADIVLEHVNDRTLHVWRSGGGRFAGAWGLVPPAGFRFAAAADFDGDGRADLVLENPVTRVLQIWTVTGPAGGGEDFSLAASVQLPYAFRLASAADFDSDGHADLLIESAVDNGLHVWRNLGGAGTPTFVGSWGRIPASGYRFAAVAHDGGAGRAGVVMKNPATGAVQFWDNPPIASPLPGVFTVRPNEVVLAGEEIVGAGRFTGASPNDLVVVDTATRAIRVITAWGSQAAWGPSQTPVSGYRAGLL